MKKSKLYVIATPIGNKADLSPRAIEVLKNVDIIACEDCRTSKKLLDSFEINTKLVSYHKFNEKQRTQELLNLIDEGKTLALISDAGTPCISDPGRIFVSELFKRGIEITSIPGACAITTFLSQIPRDGEEFAFAGFLPRVKSQQKLVFEKFSHIDTVFYESANRFLETLKNIKEFKGSDTYIAVGRELTKLYEETVYGTVDEVISHYENNTLKGEVIAMIYADKALSTDDSEMIEEIRKLKSAHYSDKDISTILSLLKGYNKNKVYKQSLTMP